MRRAADGRWGQCVRAAPPLDFHVSGTYFVEAHFHYTLFGTVVYAMFAVFPFRWPTFTGKMLDVRLGNITFWALTIGFHLTSSFLEWATSFPPPRHHFTSLPRIRSESPAFDLHHPYGADSGVLTADRPTVKYGERRGHDSGGTANAQQIHREVWATID